MENKVIVIKTEELKDISSKILTAVDSTELSIITETLEMKAKGNELVVSVTNREYFVEVKMKLPTEYDFHATVNANTFLKLISQITTESIELETVGNTLKIKGNGVYKLPLIFDGEELLKLPRIEIENKTTEFNVSADVLNSILYYNSKELTKGSIVNPIQKLHYVDELGAATFTSGACINSFTLPSPVKLLLNNRLVKLFKLFKDGDVHFTLGFDALSEEITQTKVQFMNDVVTLTAILSCDDSLLAKFPIQAVRGRANDDYAYTVSLDKSALIQTINRLTLFNNMSNVVAKNYGTFKFTKEHLTVFDANGENYEVVNYANDTNVDSEYEMKLNLVDLKATLDTCVESHLCLSFGNGQAVVISRGYIKNVIPEVKLV